MKKAKKENKQRQGISLKYKGMLLTAMLIFVVVGGDTYASDTAD